MVLPNKKRHRAGLKARIAKAKALLRQEARRNIAQLRSNQSTTAKTPLAKSVTSSVQSVKTNLETALASQSEIKREPRILSVIVTNLRYTILRCDGTVYKRIGPKVHAYALCDLTGENKEAQLIKSPTVNNFELKNNRFKFVNTDNLKSIGNTFEYRSLSLADRLKLQNPDCAETDMYLRELEI